MSEKTLKLIKDNDVKWVDLRFTDTKGKQQHVTFPADKVNANFFKGQMFDGSSIAGWKGINESDMVLLPDDSTAVLDPFAEEPQLNLVCSILEPSTMSGYDRDPRSIAARAEAYLKSTGLEHRQRQGRRPERSHATRQGWLLPGAAGRLTARHPHRHVLHPAGNGSGR